MTNKFKCIRSGGQTGVDRAALDTARKYGIEICGWCPKGGWAEDLPSSPGLLAEYPELRKTPFLWDISENPMEHAGHRCYSDDHAGKLRRIKGDYDRIRRGSISP